jgi:CheY-like chemotaxis protein
MDINMPYVNGLETTQIIRKNIKFNNVIIIACTGYGNNS